MTSRLFLLGFASIAAGLLLPPFEVSAFQAMPPMGGSCETLLMGGGSGCYCEPYDATHVFYCQGHQYNASVCPAGGHCTSFRRQCFTNLHTQHVICPLGSACGPMMGCVSGPGNCKLWTDGCVNN